MLRSIFAGIGAFLLTLALCSLTGCSDNGPSEADIQRERAEAAEKHTTTWKWLALVIGAGLLLVGVGVGTSASKADNEPRP